ncbi:MAG: hypothetical protein IAE97_09820 [Chthoniobacterales bacterium]|nr:hypothetical protein [Chthoniobacterales bacterium]
MAWRLIYTSASRLLQAGRSGFGTVARHRDIPPLVVEAAERSSQFSRQAGFDSNRVVFAYRVVRSSAGAFHLLSRIADAGTDYSGRTNHIAEHLVLSEAEASGLEKRGITPAGAMLAYTWIGSFDEAAGWLGDGDLWQPTGLHADTEGPHWGNATGDWRRVRLLAGKDTAAGMLLEYPAEYQSQEYAWILWLFAESQACCARSGWGITFTTNLQPSDDPTEFRWIGMAADSPILPRIVGTGRQHITFATEPLAEYRPPPVRPGQASPHINLPVETSSDVPASATSTRVQQELCFPQGSSCPPRPTLTKPRRSIVTPATLAIAALLVVLIAVAVGLLIHSSSREDAGQTTSMPEPSTSVVARGKDESEGALKRDTIRSATGANTDIPSKGGGVPSGIGENQTLYVDGSKPQVLPSKLPADGLSNRPVTSDASASAGSINDSAPESVPPTGGVKAPRRIVRLFPEDLKSFRWPTSDKASLQLVAINRDGTRADLRAPNKIQGEEYWKDGNKVVVFKTEGADISPISIEQHDGIVVRVSDPDAPHGETIVCVLPKRSDRPLQDIVPPEDPLRQSGLSILPENGGLVLRSSGPTPVQQILGSFDIGQSKSENGRQLQAAQFVIRAEQPPKSAIIDAATRALDSTVIDEQSFKELQSINFGLSNDGSLDAQAAKASINVILARAENKASRDEVGVANTELTALRDRVQKVVTDLQIVLDGSPPKSVAEPAAIADQKSANEYVATLLHAYLDKISEFPDPPKASSKDETFGDFRKFAQIEADKANWRGAKLYAEKAVDSRAGGGAKPSNKNALASSKTWLNDLPKVEGLFSTDSGIVRLRASELSKEIKQVFAEILGSPISAPAGLKYSLAGRRDTNGPWYLISTNVTVSPSLQATPDPTQ